MINQDPPVSVFKQKVLESSEDKLVMSSVFVLNLHWIQHEENMAGKHVISLLHRCLT